MAKKVKPPMTDAEEARACFHDFPQFTDALQEFTQTLRGKIISLVFKKLEKGVTQILVLEFLDRTKVKLTKYIPYQGSVRTTIKIGD